MTYLKIMQRSICLRPVAPGVSVIVRTVDGVTTLSVPMPSAVAARAFAALVTL